MTPKPAVVAVPQPPKGLDQSKTIAVNILMLIAAFLPAVQDFFIQMGWGTEEIASGIILINVAVRLMTKGPVAMRLAALTQGFRWLTGRKVK